MTEPKIPVYRGRFKTVCGIEEHVYGHVDRGWCYLREDGRGMWVLIDGAKGWTEETRDRLLCIRILYARQGRHCRLVV